MQALTPAQDYNPGTPVFYGIQTVFKGERLQAQLYEVARQKRAEAAELEEKVAKTRNTVKEAVAFLPSSIRADAADPERAARPYVRRLKRLRRVADGLEVIAASLHLGATYVLSNADLHELELIATRHMYDEGE